MLTANWSKMSLKQGLHITVDCKDLAYQITPLFTCGTTLLLNSIPNILAHYIIYVHVHHIFHSQATPSFGVCPSTQPSTHFCTRIIQSLLCVVYNNNNGSKAEVLGT